MSVTDTDTVLEITEDALRKVGIVAIDEVASADELLNARRDLGRMLKAWQNKGWVTWLYTSGSLALTTAASYTLDPVRPLRIVNARFRRSGVETPMIRMGRDEYDALPIKTTTGIPTQFYYDRQREAARLYVWPVLAAANGETIEYTYEREIADVSSGSIEVDVPGEWYEATVYNLAVRLADTYAVAVSPAIEARAQMFLDDALGADHSPSVYWGDYE